MRELVKNYLYLMHEKDGLENVILTEQDLTVKDQEEDGFDVVTTIQMSVARERKRIMLIRFAGRVRNMKNFRLERRLPQ